MENPKLELSDAYRKSRGTVSILSGIAVAWAAAQFNFTTVKLPMLGDATLSGYGIPLILASCIVYAVTRSTIEFMMQSVDVRRWKLAQFDYKITHVVSTTSILFLSASGVTRSLHTILAIVGIGLFLAAGFFIGCFVLTIALIPIILFFRKKKRPNPSVASAVFSALSYGSIISGLGIIALIAIGGSNVLFRGYEYFGLTETPNSISVLVFLFTAIVFVLGCFKHHVLLQKVFAFEPPFTVETKKREDGTTLVTFRQNPNSSDKSKFSTKEGQTKP
jgi:hypothetical protein